MPRKRALKVLQLEGFPHAVMLTELDMLILANLPAMQEPLVRDFVEILEYPERTVRYHITKLVKRKWIRRTRLGRRGEVYLEPSKQAQRFALSLLPKWQK